MLLGLGFEMEHARAMRESVRTPKLCRSDLWSHGFLQCLQKVGEI